MTDASQASVRGDGDTVGVAEVLLRRPFAAWGGDSGPELARCFHRALALIFLLAWTSLAIQVRVLVGHDGLLPLGDFVDAARAAGTLSLSTFPSWLMLVPLHHDGVLLAGTICGAGVALLALGGIRPRLCCAVQTILYLGYVIGCRTFLAFQWDNLLLECALLAVFLSTLPARRPSPLIHFLFRALLFKLYFESGLAKWQSPLFDWRDGSAMTFYYQTAPLPTPLAWYAHHLPRGWHLLESRATLLIELIVPFAAFGPRRARLAAAAILSGFQVLNIATANYGFFCFLSLALHLFLLDDDDVRRLTQWGRRQLSWASNSTKKATATAKATTGGTEPPTPAPASSRLAAWWSTARVRRVTRGAGILGAATWTLVSLSQALFQFGDLGPAASSALLPTIEFAQVFRVVNTYHLFSAVTRDRIEPEFQTQIDDRWQPLHLHYKPGDPALAPPFVAPHQPRVDFQLWFYGLAAGRRPPAYVAELAARLCDAPDAVVSLFASPPPPGQRQAVRVVFWRYRFTTPAERRASGHWWWREFLGAGEPVTCTAPPPARLTD